MHRRHTPTYIQSNHPNTRNTTPPNSSKNQLNPTRTSHHNTPLDPLSRGETTPQSTYSQQETSTRTSPLERGWGCVTSVHSHKKIKNIHPKPKKYHPSKQQQNHLIPCRTSHHNTPLDPLSRGESKTPQSTYYQQETSTQTSPLERGGLGV